MFGSNIIVMIVILQDMCVHVCVCVCVCVHVCDKEKGTKLPLNITNFQVVSQVVECN